MNYTTWLKLYPIIGALYVRRWGVGNSDTFLYRLYDVVMYDLMREREVAPHRMCGAKIR